MRVRHWRALPDAKSRTEEYYVSHEFEVISPRQRDSQAPPTNSLGVTYDVAWIASPRNTLSRSAPQTGCRHAPADTLSPDPYKDVRTVTFLSLLSLERLLHSKLAHRAWFLGVEERRTKEVENLVGGQGWGRRKEQGGPGKWMFIFNLVVPWRLILEHFGRVRTLWGCRMVGKWKKTVEGLGGCFSEADTVKVKRVGSVHVSVVCMCRW